MRNARMQDARMRNGECGEGEGVLNGLVCMKGLSRSCAREGCGELVAGYSPVQVDYQRTGAANSTGCLGH